MTRRIRRLLLAASVLASIGLVTVAFARPNQDNKPELQDDAVTVTVAAGKGRLGVAVIQISPELRTHLGAPAGSGVLVDAVRPNSPAAKAGVHVGDVIVELDRTPTQSAGDLLGAMADRKKGEAVVVAVVRDRARMEVRATLEDDPGPAIGRGRLIDPRMRDWFRMPSGNPELAKELDDARARIEQLERRLEKLEHP